MRVTKQNRFAVWMLECAYLCTAYGKDCGQQHSNSRAVSDHAARYERRVLGPVSRDDHRGAGVRKKEGWGGRALVAAARRLNALRLNMRQAAGGFFKQSLCRNSSGAD
jgi:hypothetical protein